jgi:hypothetical protein
MFLDRHRREHCVIGHPHLVEHRSHALSRLHLADVVEVSGKAHYVAAAYALDREISPSTSAHVDPE